MKNFVQAGNRMTIIAAAAVLSGEVVVTGDLLGVAEASALIGEETVVVLTGVFELPKVAAQAFAQGAVLYWDAAAKNLTTTVAANKIAGKAFAGALAADAKALVRMT